MKWRCKHYIVLCSEFVYRKLHQTPTLVVVIVNPCCGVDVTAEHCVCRSRRTTLLDLHLRCRKFSDATCMKTALRRRRVLSHVISVQIQQGCPSTAAHAMCHLAMPIGKSQEYRVAFAWCPSPYLGLQSVGGQTTQVLWRMASATSRLRSRFLLTIKSSLLSQPYGIAVAPLKPNYYTGWWHRVSRELVVSWQWRGVRRANHCTTKPHNTTVTELTFYSHSTQQNNSFQGRSSRPEMSRIEDFDKSGKKLGVNTSKVQERNPW